MLIQIHTNTTIQYDKYDNTIQIQIQYNTNTTYKYEKLLYYIYKCYRL